MTTCPICFDEHPEGEPTCEEKAAWWDSLTPEQQAEEYRMMAEYTEGS